MVVTLKNIFLTHSYFFSYHRDFYESLGAATQYDAYGRTIVVEICPIVSLLVIHEYFLFYLPSLFALGITIVTLEVGKRKE